MSTRIHQSYTVPVLLVIGACIVEGPEPKAHDIEHALPTEHLVHDPIFKSLDDFDTAVRSGANPFHLMALEAVAQFRETLIFDGGRVQAMDHESMRKGLPLDRYLDLMYAFGFEHGDHPMFAGIDPPHPSAPKPGRDYCVLHGPRPLAAAAPPPAIPNVETLLQALDRPRGVLARMSPDSLRDLRETATFNEGGLTSFRFARINKELSPEDYKELLSMFGIHDDDGKEGYYCHSRGSCKKSMDWLCNLNTC